jgi:hypothetical protein
MQRPERSGHTPGTHFEKFHVLDNLSLRNWGPIRFFVDPERDSPHPCYANSGASCPVQVVLCLNQRLPLWSSSTMA